MRACLTLDRRAALGALIGLAAAALYGCDARVENEKKRSTRLGDPVGLAQTAAGFSVGSPTARKVAYVFFDMQCPHCGRLWQATKPLQDRVRFVWIPVALLNDASLQQGAAILATQDPGAAMERHEADLLSGGKGLVATSGTAAERDKVQANTKLLELLGVQSVPYIAGRNENSDRVVTQTGTLPTKELAALLGI